MAGSIRYFSYMCDDNIRYAIAIDESNGKAKYISDVTPSSELFLPAETPFPGKPPKRFFPRTISCVNLGNPNLKRRFVCARKSVFLRAARDGGFIETVPEGYWAITGAYNEQYPLTPQYQIDTGLTDGTPLSERAGDVFQV